MSLHLALDACCWSNRRGFGRFTRELFGELIPQAVERGHRLSLVVDALTAEGTTFPQGAEPVVVPTREQPTRAAAADSARSPADLLRLGRAAARLRPDVLFFPAVYSYYPVPTRRPMVITFHDAIAEEHPGLIFPHWRSRLLWRLKTRLALAQASRILTVSESARRQVAGAFGLREENIAVTHEGPGADFHPPEDPAAGLAARRELGLPEEGPLLVYLGGLSPHKNLDGLLRAFARLPPGAHLALVGDHSGDAFFSCYQELRGLVEELDLEGQVTFTGFVPNAQLATLLGGATALVLPSFSEGFGLPVVEAMACGLPVAASRAGSLPEVVGEAGLLFDPHSIDDMAATLKRLLEDDALCADLRTRGLERARSLSWATAARGVLDLLEEVARG
jgi:glycosyltransferase involved in cell wall biosynthesis